MINSKIRQYIGIAATAILNNNDVILEVYCPDFVPNKMGKVSLGKKMATGNRVVKRVGYKKNVIFSPERADRATVTAKLGEMKFDKDVVELEDPEGNPKIVSVKTADTIECEFLGNLTNQDVPDIHIGEKVMVHNVAGTEKFYWTALGRDDHIRQVEHYKIKIADQRMTIKDLNDDNTYLFEMDTRNGKTIRLQTSSTDGEKFRYFIEIDAILNTITLKDNAGNIIKLDSNIPRIYMLNNLGTLVDLNAPDIFFNAPNNINLTCGNNYNITVANEMQTIVASNKSVSVGNNLNTKIGADYSLTVSGTWKAMANALEMTIAGTWKATCATLQFLISGAASIVDSVGNTLHPK